MCCSVAAILYQFRCPPHIRSRPDDDAAVRCATVAADAAAVDRPVAVPRDVDRV